MAISIANASAIAGLNAIADLCDAGAGAALLNIYSGTVPTDADTALSGNTLLAQLTMSDPAFGAAVDNIGKATVTANSITSDSDANATGTATFFRITDSNSNVIYQGAVGTSGAELNLDTTSIVATGTVNVTSCTLNLPE